MKTLQLNVSRNVPMNADYLANSLQANAPAFIGQAQVDADGSGTLTRLERVGNRFEFAFEFDQGSKASGRGTGSFTLTALGQGTTRIDCRGTLELEGTASKMPEFMLKKLANHEIDKIMRDMIIELGGPDQGRGVA